MSEPEVAFAGIGRMGLAMARNVAAAGFYLTALCGTYVMKALYVKESMGEQFVVADATRAMLDVGTAAVAEQGIANVLYVEADAYALPFTGD